MNLARSISSVFLRDTSPAKARALAMLDEHVALVGQSSIPRTEALEAHRVMLGSLAIALEPVLGKAAKAYAAQIRGLSILKPKVARELVARLPDRSKRTWVVIAIAVLLFLPRLLLALGRLGMPASKGARR